MTKIHHEVNGTRYVFDEAKRMAWALTQSQLFFESHCPEAPETDRDWNVMPGWTLKAEGERGREEFQKVIR